MSITPLRRQYLKIKQQHPDAIVFFRLGDFYETFDDDARVTARELEIVLTSREMGKGMRVPLAGIPYHALEGYLARLINKGYKVAICEQMSPPGKGLVEREVVRIVTPGTVIEPGLLIDKSNNYLVSVTVEGEYAGIAYIDITTGEFATTQLPVKQVADELERLHPAEVLLPQDFARDTPEIKTTLTSLDVYWFDYEVAYRLLIEHFGVISLEGYGCEHSPLAIKAAGAVLHYISENQKSVLVQITGLTTYSTASFMVIDAQTRRNLELFQSARWGLTSGSLISVIDLTGTAMGGRLLKKWLGQPLLTIESLVERQDAVGWFVSSTFARQRVTSLLADILDIERLVNRVRSNVASPRDLIALRNSLEKVPEIEAILNEYKTPEFISSGLKSCPEVTELITTAIADDPSKNLEQGGVIKKGFSAEIDKLRELLFNTRKYLTDLEQRERENTGIKTLKVRYNKVFGYYIEISRSYVDRVPDTYIRKQTLVNAERYFTPELKEFESTILNAQERIVEMEVTLFRQICQQITGSGEHILGTARALAVIDVVCSLAEVAVRYGYNRPELTGNDVIEIKDGRHPVVERSKGCDDFIPNDVYLNNGDTQIAIITGPNMAGKSTYLKQVAILVLLAQIGSYIPCASASIGIVDRIFTRIGAQEDLTAGQSTFMVEMVETANILNNATGRSLVILDEVGRGTSTYDGLSIAWAVVEFIHNHPRLRSKTLFATHYHELVQLAGLLPRVKNLNVAVTEEHGKVVFLRKVIPGGADKSYGIHVAQLAGLPVPVINRAQEVLSNLETDHVNLEMDTINKAKKESSGQLPLFDHSHRIVEEIRGIDIDSLTPLEAITQLYKLKRRAQEEEPDNE
jgi:DNA mismatch repair protein MutS